MVAICIPSARITCQINRERLHREAEAGKTRLARDLNIHLTTLNSLLDDSWERIERDTIERLCDYLHCDLTDILDLHPDQFWRPLIYIGNCHILRGVTTSKNKDKPFLEEQDKGEIVGYVQGYLLGVTGLFTDAHKLRSENQIVEYREDGDS